MAGHQFPHLFHTVVWFDVLNILIPMHTVKKHIWQALGMSNDTEPASDKVIPIHDRVLSLVGCFSLYLLQIVMLLYIFRSLSTLYFAWFHNNMVYIIISISILLTTHIINRFETLAYITATVMYIIWFHCVLHKLTYVCG